MSGITGSGWESRKWMRYPGGSEEDSRKWVGSISQYCGYKSARYISLLSEKIFDQAFLELSGSSFIDYLYNPCKLTRGRMHFDMRGVK